MIGGLFSAVSEYITINNINISITPLGVPDRFIEQGTIPELITECGFDYDGIYKTILNVNKKFSK